MLARAIRPARRLVHTDAYNRLLLDINAAHHNDQLVKDPAPPLEKSAAAQRGQALRGDVQLPRELQEAVNKALEDADKPAVRVNAIELYAHLRRTSAILPPPASYRERQALTTTYDKPTSIAYLAGLMPSVYGATLYALTAARSRLELLGDWVPDRLVDYGSGTGSAAWAFEAVWGPKTTAGQAREYVGLDASTSMVELSSGILGALSTKTGSVFHQEEAGDSVRMVARAYQLPIPSPSTALAKLQLGPTSSLPGTGKRTIALAAFTLGDQGTKEKRKEMVRAMWESGAEVLVIVERGTPGGSRMVIEAREQLLMFGKRGLGFEEEGRAMPGGPKNGSFVLAPCSHDKACPLHHSTRTFCHFSQRVQSPPFLRHTKHSSKGSDDAMLSYVVIQRGSRPTSTPELSIASAFESSSLELASFGSAPPPPPQPVSIGEELAWPRIVAPPMKRSGHVVFEMCASSGDLERHTIPKSQGRQAYYDARKADWGDSFPHAPKNGVQPAPAGKVAPLVEDKFGKDRSKLRSKKAMRTQGLGMEKEEGRRKRSSAKRGNESRDGEVQEIELDFDFGQMPR